MARQTVPYNVDTLDKGAFQVWQYEPQEFLKQNAFDLTPFLGTDIVVGPVVAGLPITPLAYRTIEGRILIRLYLVYTGPLTSNDVTVLGGLQNLSFFQGYNYFTAPQHTANIIKNSTGQPDITSYSLSPFVNATNGILEQLVLLDSPGVAFLPLDTNEIIRVSAEFEPLP